MKKQRNIGESSYNFRTYYVPIFGLNNEPRDREIFFFNHTETRSYNNNVWRIERNWNLDKQKFSWLYQPYAEIWTVLANGN